MSPYKGIQILAGNDDLLRDTKATLRALTNNKWPANIDIAMTLCDDDDYVPLSNYYQLVIPNRLSSFMSSIDKGGENRCKVAMQVCNIAVHEGSSSIKVDTNHDSDEKQTSIDSNFFSDDNIENADNPINEVLEKNKEHIRREFKRIGYYDMSDVPRVDRVKERITEWFVSKGMDRNHLQVLTCDDISWRICYTPSRRHFRKSLS